MRCNYIYFRWKIFVIAICRLYIPFLVLAGLIQALNDYIAATAAAAAHCRFTFRSWSRWMSLDSTRRSPWGYISETGSITLIIKKTNNPFMTPLIFYQYLSMAFRLYLLSNL